MKSILRISIVLLTMLLVLFFICGIAIAERVIDIPSNVTTIEEECFAGDTSIDAVHFPATLTHIGKNAFFGCSSLRSLYFEGSLEQWNQIEIEEGNDSFLDTWLFCTDNGVWGTCRWELNCYGTLTIHSGTGADTNGVSPWNNQSYKILRVVTDDNVILPSDSSGLFQRVSNCTEMDLSGFNTVHVQNMSDMFKFCYSLTEIDLSSFDTSNVTSMKCMFDDCESMEEIDVTGFDTRKVTSMMDMFAMCRNLKSLNLSGFDTSNVQEMGGLFWLCKSLSSIDISHFDTHKVNSMGSMFYYCQSLTELDLTNFDTSNVTNMNSMFSHCENLTELDVSSFDTSNVSSGAFMFEGCTKLKELDLSGFDTSNFRYINSMFKDCSSLIRLDLSGFNTANVGNFSFAFEYCSNLKWLDISGFDTRIAYELRGLFTGCDELQYIKVGPQFTFMGQHGIVLHTFPDKIWTAQSDGNAYTAQEIAENRNLIADAYYLDDGFEYQNDDDTYCTVVGYHGASLSLEIPARSPDLHIVKAIGESAFADKSNMTGIVTIPNTVETIGSGAFSGCSGLTGNLLISDSVRSIGNSAFAGCSSLTGTLSLGNSLESIGSSAFSNAGFTGNLVFPASLRSIGSSAFYSCRGFTGTLTVPRTISVVNDAVFSECTGFDGNLIIEDGITSIGDSSFACKYPNNFKGNLVIPDSVTSIGQSAFRGCGCNGTLTISQNVTEIQWQTFFFSRFTGSLTIPYGVTSIGAGAFGMTVFTGTLSLPETLISIGGEAFCGQANERPFVGSLSIPNSVTTLGAMSFGYCGFDGYLTLSRSITVVPSSCFASCSFTGKLYIPANIKRIESNAFSGNCFTGDLIIPDTVVYATGFSGCTFDGNLVISKNMTEIPSSAFFGCNRLKGSIIVPEGISTIGASAFSGCSGFDGELSLPDSLTTIGDSAFKDCSGLGGNIIIPKNVTKISWNAFNECSGINGYIYVGRSVTTINGKPFSGTNPVKFLLDNNSYAHLNASKHGLVPYQVMDELNLTLNIFAGTEVDDPITADCVVSGGLAPYMYKYEVNISDGSYYYTGWRTNKTSSFYPVTDGYYTFTVTVRDSLGNTVTKTNGNVYRHLLTEGESNARENVYFARYMNNFFFNDIPEPQAIQGYWYFSLHDDYYPWVVEFIEYLSKFSPTNPSYYIDIYNNLFNQEDKKDFLLEKALVMCSTGNDFKMYELMSMPDGIKTLNSFTKLMSVNDNTGFINILHDVTGNSDSLLDNVFNSYCNDYIGSDDLPAALNGIVANSDDRTYTANSMRLLKDFKTFKDLAGTYGVMKAVYDDMVVDVLNTLALFDTVDMSQLYQLASTWEVTGDSAQKEVGSLLKSLAGVNREDRLALLLGRNGYKSIVKCFGKLLDTGSGKLIKLSKKSGGEYNFGLAVYGIITSVLELGAGQESYADKFQELETSTEIVNAAWNDFIVRRGEYSNNPSEENFEHVIYACINYLQSAAVSETTFVALVAEARQHIILQWAGFGQPMLEAAEHSSDHATALNTFVNSIRQYYKNWKAIDNYDYSIVKSQFSNALSTYKQWSYESYANNSGVNGGW